MVEPTIFLDEGYQKIWQGLIALPEFVDFKGQQNVDCRLPVRFRGELRVILAPCIFGYVMRLDLLTDDICSRHGMLGNKLTCVLCIEEHLVTY